jgi:hypothetical protein
VLFATLILSVGLALLFGVDAGLLFVSYAHEFSIPYGPIALFAVVTLLAALPMMKEVGIRVANLRIFIFLIIGVIAIAGSVVHRVFLVLWILGLLIGFFIISKSFRQKSFLTFKRIIYIHASLMYNIYCIFTTMWAPVHSHFFIPPDLSFITLLLNKVITSPRATIYIISVSCHISESS